MLIVAKGTETSVGTARAEDPAGSHIDLETEAVPAESGVPEADILSEQILFEKMLIFRIELAKLKDVVSC